MVRSADASIQMAHALHRGDAAPDGGWHAPGRDFATQDYLALMTGPLAPARNPDAELRARLAQFLLLARVDTHVSGTAAIRAALRSTLRPGDDVIVDAGAHPAMFEAVAATGATLHRSPPGSVDAVERRLRRLVGGPRHSRIHLALSGVSAYGSLIADLPGLTDLARDYDARLILDVSHDLGAIGQAGGGVMEVQGCMGRVDVVVGSFAKVFGGPGGFAGFRRPAAGPAAGHAPPPFFAARILAAFDTVTSAEGAARRRRLHDNVLRLRNHLMADGLAVMGQPSPLVSLRLPMLTATARTALLQSAGLRVGLVHAPHVGSHAPRWRLHLSSEHCAADLDDLADLIRDVSRVFDRRHPSRSATYA